MKMVKKIIIFSLFIIMCFGCYFTYTGYRMYREALNREPLMEKIEMIKSKDNYTKIEDVPNIYLKAVVSVEDHRFYKHKGIDILSICRAIIHDIKNLEFVEGGSTITQQVAKNIYFTQDKTVERKVAEVFMAFNMERHLDKKEILELYLNTSYFGNGYYSIGEASLGYFNVLPKDMTDCEAVTLAGVFIAPTIYNPSVDEDILKLRERQVINKMIKYDNLDKTVGENLCG